jgi:2,3-bisphosphoglycerate-independent phosphoglycerate mutase
MFDEKLERYIEIPSDRVSFDERPWMKAAEITDALIHELRTGSYDHARLNFANGDMVGHTGKLDAAVVAVECVDLCLARILPVLAELKGALITTADHGNADQMHELDKAGKALLAPGGKPRSKTSHTLNPVPFSIYAPSMPELRIDPSVKAPRLANVAATVLSLLGYQAPEGYEPSLLG